MRFQLLNKRTTVVLTGNLVLKKDSLILDGGWSVNGQRSQKFNLRATTEGILNSIEGEHSFDGSFRLGRDTVKENASLTFEKKIDGYHIVGNGSNENFGRFSTSGMATRIKRTSTKSVFSFEIKKEYVTGARLLLEEEKDAGEVVFDDGVYTYFSSVDGKLKDLSEEDVRAITSSSVSGKAASNRGKQKIEDGTIITKHFLDGEGNTNPYRGYIESYHSKTRSYTLIFDDGEMEEVEEEVVHLIAKEGCFSDNWLNTKQKAISSQVDQTRSLAEANLESLKTTYTEFLPEINNKIVKVDNKLEKSNERLEDRIRNVQQDLRQRGLEYAAMKKKQTVLETKVDKQEKELRGVKRQQTSQAILNRATNQRISRLELQCSQLQGQCSQLHGQCSQLQGENAHLRGQVEELNQANLFSSVYLSHSDGRSSTLKRKHGMMEL